MTTSGASTKERELPPGTSRHAPPRLSHSRGPLAPAVVVTVVAGALWALELPRIRPQAMGNFGFITVLPAGFYAAVALLVLGFVLALRCVSPPRWLLAGQVILLLLFLYGTVLIAEPLARFATAWLHAGFTDYIAQHGRTVPSYDARFNWPGFFSATAMLSRAAGLRSPVTLLRWAPLYFNVIYAVGVYAVAATATRTERVRWLAVWLFLTTNWIGQDYFSPQAFAYLLALAFIVILLRWFRSSSSRDRLTTRLWSRAPGEDMSKVVSGRERIVLVAIALFLFGAMVVSHQLTAPVVIVWTFALVLARRCRLASLPYVLIALFALWISYGAVEYWSGHLNALFGGLGNLGSSITQNLNKRVSGSASRIVVQHVRLAFTASAFVLAFVGVVRRWRAGYGDLSLILLACSPFLLIGIQSYGGEALLRLVFFSLPFVSVLGAMALLPRFGRPRLASSAAVFAVCVALVPLFIMSRYGNELWDMVTPQEYAAFQWVYRTAPAGSTLVTLESDVPLGYRDLLKYNLQPQSTNAILSEPRDAERLLSTPGPGAYLIVTRDQVEFGHLFDGLPPDWANRVVAAVLATGDYRVAFANAQAEVLSRIGPSPILRGSGR